MLGVKRRSRQRGSAVSLRTDIKGTGVRHRSLNLGYFGTVVDLRVAERDIRDAEFFYGLHQLTPQQTPDYIACLWADGGFFRSLNEKDHAQKVADLTYADGTPIRRVDFSEWSAAPSVVPPFAAVEVSSRLAVFRGSVVQPARGKRGLLIVGSNHSGKTAMTVELLQRGWKLVSSHLAVLNRASGKASTFYGPLGLRGPTLRLIEGANLAESDYRETHSEASGRVALVRPDVLFKDCLGTSCEINRVVRVNRSSRVGLGIERDAFWSRNFFRTMGPFPADSYSAVVRSLDGLPLTNFSYSSEFELSSGADYIHTRHLEEANKK